MSFVEACVILGVGAAHLELEKAVGHITPEGGDPMILITVTFHVNEWAITIQVKCRNRHSHK